MVLPAAAAALAAACGGDGAPSAPPGPGPRTAPGGPVAGLTDAERARFEAGRQVFDELFLISTGLGPLVNGPSCSTCHVLPALGGSGAQIAVHGTLVRDDGSCDDLADRGGPVFQTDLHPELEVLIGSRGEPIPPEASTAVRAPPDVFGFGLLDAVPDAVLEALADPGDADGDGISGRVHRLADGSIGRFGRKAHIATLAEFNELAFQQEMGITTPNFPSEGTVGGDPLPAGLDPLPEPEISAERVALADDFVRFLAPPAPLPLDVRAERGRELFAEIGCAGCHVPRLETGAAPSPALAGRAVEAYTDLLLHDMGPALADICFGDAAPEEFRTEPLMGLRHNRQFLHDGRAGSVAEAIAAHGGEAAASRTRFSLLDGEAREAVLAFLEAL